MEQFQSHEEYRGPHRRSKDLPDSTARKDRGAVRMQTINVFMILAAGAVSLGLLWTIQKSQRLAERLLSGDGENLAVLQALLRRQQLLTGVLLLVAALTIASTVGLILWPMEEYIGRIRAHKMLPMRGGYELRYLAKAYNMMFEENLRHNEELRYKVEHDALTGLYNRGAYEKLLESHLEQGNIALLWIDVDKFKGVNDRYGHDVGDKILQKVAAALSGGFRASDYPCRTGGDEFAVIMTDIHPKDQNAVTERVNQARAKLLDVSDGLPAVTLSIGVAFSDQRREGESLFKMADKALYRVKEAGRNGCAFFGEEDRGEDIKG